jgi:tetratricopeptide (TPR) repeat protein
MAKDMPLAYWHEYFRAQCGVIIEYFGKLFWPTKLQLYPWVQRVEDWTEWVPQALALTALFALGAWLLWRGPKWAGFAILWPFFILGPTSSFIPIPYEPAMEYRMYLPALPLLSLLVFLAARRVPAKALVSVGAILAVALATVSHLRARDYETGVKLYTQQIGVDPKGLFGWDALSGAYLGDGLQEKAAQAAWKTIDLALVEKAPDFLGRSYYTLGLLALENKKDDEAVDFFRRSIAAAGTHSAKVALAGLLAKRGETEEATKLIHSVLAYMPDRADALFILYEMKMQKADYMGAEEVLNKIDRFHPGHPAVPDQQIRLMRKKAGR